MNDISEDGSKNGIDIEGSAMADYLKGLTGGCAIEWTFVMPCDTKPFPEYPEEPFEFWHGERKLGNIPAEDVEVVLGRCGEIVYISISEEAAERIVDAIKEMDEDE